MMDYLKNFFNWLKTLPLWGKITSVAAVAALVVVYFLTSSCGIARVKVYDSQNNEISVTSEPNTSINVTVKASHNGTKSESESAE